MPYALADEIRRIAAHEFSRGFEPTGCMRRKDVRRVATIDISCFNHRYATGLPLRKNPWVETHG
jgi:hypothetical protein